MRPNRYPTFGGNIVQVEPCCCFGGASGIGLAVVELLLDQGHDVLAVDLSAAAIETAKGALAAHGDKVSFARLDVSDEAAVANWLRAFGSIAGLVNAAGIGVGMPALETSAELFRKVLNVNLVGTFIITREVAKVMKGAGQGSIVNIASVSGLRGNVRRAAYGASKAGVIQLTRTLAAELAEYGVRVNAVAPGPVETPMVRAMHTPASRAAWARTVPMRRYGEVTEIAHAVAFLLDCGKSNYITGETLCVDGGFAAAGLLD